MREKIIDLLYAENVRSDCGIERLADELCTIDPVKRGRWEQVGDNAWKCSRCGEVSCCEGSYCPDCGAKMEGEDDG